MHKKKVTISEFAAEDKRKIYLPGWGKEKKRKKKKIRESKLM